MRVSSAGAPAPSAPPRLRVPVGKGEGVGVAGGGAAPLGEGVAGGDEGVGVGGGVPVGVDDGVPVGVDDNVPVGVPGGVPVGEGGGVREGDALSLPVPAGVAEIAAHAAAASPPAVGANAHAPPVQTGEPAAGPPGAPAAQKESLPHHPHDTPPPLVFTPLLRQGPHAAMLAQESLVARGHWSGVAAYVYVQPPPVGPNELPSTHVPVSSHHPQLAVTQPPHVPAPPHAGTASAPCTSKEIISALKSGEEDQGPDPAASRYLYSAKSYASPRWFMEGVCVRVAHTPTASTRAPRPDERTTQKRPPPERDTGAEKDASTRVAAPIRAASVRVDACASSA